MGDRTDPSPISSGAREVGRDLSSGALDSPPDSRDAEVHPFTDEELGLILRYPNREYSIFDFPLPDEDK